MQLWNMLYFIYPECEAIKSPIRTFYNSTSLSTQCTPVFYLKFRYYISNVLSCDYGRHLVTNFREV